MVYPQWDRFLEQRARLDPDGVFLSPYLRQLLGVTVTDGVLNLLGDVTHPNGLGEWWDRPRRTARRSIQR
jgi:hypothetical protein